MRIAVTGIKEAQDALEKRIQSYAPMMQEAISIATRKAATTADLYYHNYVDHSEEQPAVVCSAMPTTIQGETVSGGVNADGGAVVFLEFGAGDVTGFGEHGETIENFEATSGVSVYPGSFSEVNSQQYSNKGYWVFGGRVYRGVYPRRGMFHASQEIKAELSDATSQSYEIAKQVLGG